MKKMEVKMNKPVYLGISILDTSKILMYESRYDYIKPKYGDRAKLCYVDTDSFVIHIITKNFYEDTSDDVERWFDTSNCDCNDKRPLPIGMNKKVIGLFKDELGGKIIKEFCALRPKAYAYLMNDDNVKKKAKGTTKSVIKNKTMFENYTDCLFNDKIILKSQKRFKSYLHEVYTEEVNKIALSSNDDKRLQTFDGVTTYPYGNNALNLCENEMLRVCKAKAALKMLSKEREGEMYVKEKENVKCF